jgi:hypothetical protein
LKFYAANPSNFNFPGYYDFMNVPGKNETEFMLAFGDTMVL